jgi:hypothetical protein
MHDEIVEVDMIYFKFDIWANFKSNESLEGFVYGGIWFTSISSGKGTLSKKSKVFWLVIKLLDFL